MRQVGPASREASTPSKAPPLHLPSTRHSLFAAISLAAHGRSNFLALLLYANVVCVNTAPRSTQCPQSIKKDEKRNAGEERRARKPGTAGIGVGSRGRIGGAEKSTRNIESSAFDHVFDGLSKTNTIRSRATTTRIAGALGFTSLYFVPRLVLFKA